MVDGVEIYLTLIYSLLPDLRYYWSSVYQCIPMYTNVYQCHDPNSQIAIT